MAGSARALLTKTSMVAVAACAMAFGMAQDARAQFNGTPTSPQPFVSHPDYDLFDVQVHSRNAANSDTLEAMSAHHGSNCSGPPATHTTSSYESAVFICNNHVMTALSDSGYGAIYLTPARRLDCTGSCSVQWEMSTQRGPTPRDWPDIYVTPWEDNLALPLLSRISDGTDLQGPPRNTVHVAPDNAEARPMVATVINGNVQVVNQADSTPVLNAGITAGTNEAATRQTFRLTLSAGRIRFERLASATATALVYFDGSAPNFKRTNSMIVTFGHHSYNPEKDCTGCSNTWHWDNMVLTPSVPFTLIHADRRTSGLGGGTVNFKAAAPANAYLRFSAICQPLVDGVAAPRTVFQGHPEHFSSYFVPIARGKQSVNFTFRTDGWYERPCLAKDITIWSPDGGAQMTAPAAPTNLRLVGGL